MNTSEEILSTLNTIASTKQTVSLISIYKTIPLAFDAQCIMVENGIGYFSVHKYQMAITVIIKKIYIQSPLLKEYVQANVAKMNPVKNLLGLDNFRYAGDYINRRTLIRVEPETSIPVLLYLKGVAVRAELADISVGGISVYIDPFFLDNEEDGEKMISSHCEVHLNLPSDNWKPIKIKCAIRNVIRDTLSGRYRIGFQLYPDKASQALLDKYVTKRQAEMMQEIKNLYEKSVKV